MNTSIWLCCGQEAFMQLEIAQAGQQCKHSSPLKHAQHKHRATVSPDLWLRLLLYSLTAEEIVTCNWDDGMSVPQDVCAHLRLAICLVGMTHCLRHGKENSRLIVSFVSLEGLPLTFNSVINQQIKPYGQCLSTLLSEFWSGHF